MVAKHMKEVNLITATREKRTQNAVRSAVIRRLMSKRTSTSKNVTGTLLHELAQENQSQSRFKIIIFY